MKKWFCALMVFVMVLSCWAQAEEYEADIFSELAEYEFTYMSGVGAWRAVLSFGGEGTFWGYYEDSDMGDTGDGYPNGTVYTCSFSGRMTVAEKTGEYTYLLDVESAVDPCEEAEWIDEDIGTRYVYADSYGLENGTQVTLYLPGTPKADLDGNFVPFAFLPEDAECLDTFGFYCGETGAGFLGTLLPTTCSAGSWNADYFQGGAMGMEFIDVVVDEEADTFSFWPCETVTDVTLEKIVWDEEPAYETLYTADSMASNQVLNVNIFFGDVLPDLRIRCTDASGEEECWYVTQSGMDGSPVLMDESELEY